MRVLMFIAIRQLWSRKLLNGIALGGVVLGIVTLLGVRGILDGFRNKFVESVLQVSPHVTLLDTELRPLTPMLERLSPAPAVVSLAHPRPGLRQARIRRPLEIIAAVERMQGVVAASRSLAGSAVLLLGTREYSVEVRGIEPAAQERVTPIAGYLTEGDYAAFASSHDGILLGIGVAQRLGARLGDMLTSASPLGVPITLRVVGIFDAHVPPIDMLRVYLPLRTAQALLGRPDIVRRIELKLTHPEAARALAPRLEAVFGYDAESWQEANANFLSIFAMQDTIMNFVVAAILAVGGFGIMAVQVMIVLQKTRDIAILRSVGFNSRAILTIILLQGLAVASAGGVIGGISGHLLLGELAKLETPMDGLVRTDRFLVTDDPIMYVYGLAFGLLVGLVASVVPALRAARIQPVDVLRGQIG